MHAWLIRFMFLGSFCVFIHPAMLLFKKLAWFKILDAWLIRFMVHCSWCMAHATWLIRSMVHFSWCMAHTVHGSWCTMHSTWFMVNGAWFMFMVHGSWCMIHGSWFMVHGSWFLVPGSWFMVHGLHGKQSMKNIAWCIALITMFYGARRNHRDLDSYWTLLTVGGRPKRKTSYDNIY